MRHGDLKNYVDELCQKVSLDLTKKRSKGKRLAGRGSMGLLHFAKQIAVLVELATLHTTSCIKSFANNPELEKQVAFLVSVLRGATTFSQQQIVDLKQLLAMLSALINGNSSVKQRNNLPLREKDGKEIKAIDMSLPLQQLKTHWQMCMSCGEVMFGVKAEKAKCTHGGCDALLKKPVFGFS
jgi:hypothetical protein